MGVYISTKTFIRDSVKLRCVCALGWNGVGPDKKRKNSICVKCTIMGPLLLRQCLTRIAFEGIAKFIYSCVHSGLDLCESYMATREEGRECVGGVRLLILHDY